MLYALILRAAFSRGINRGTVLIVVIWGVRAGFVDAGKFWRGGARARDTVGGALQFKNVAKVATMVLIHALFGRIKIGAA